MTLGVRAGSDGELGHLKRLLLVDEQREIDALRREVSALDERVGSENRFCRAVADSLVVALKVTEIEQHRELAGVMAPIVVAGIRREIAESKDLMVEALFPIVGRLVTTAVAQALRQLAEDVNRRIESVLSPWSLRLRLRALKARRPLAELLLVEASKDRIDTLLLLDRASGAVLASSCVRDGRIEAEPRATDSLNLVGGLMAAIIEFANHALSDGHGELRALDFGGRTALLRASPLRVVAAIGGGPTSAKLDACVDEAFLTFLEAQPDDAAAALAAMHGRFLALNGRKPWNRRISALTLLGPVVAALLACAAATGWSTLRERDAEASALAQIAQAPELAGYPLSLAFDRERGTLTVSALVPDAAAWSVVRGRIEGAFPNVRIEDRVAVLSDGPEVQRTRAALRDGEAMAAGLRAGLDTLSQRLDGVVPLLEGIEAARKRDEAAARDALAALGDKLDRIERETAAALSERPLRAESAEAREAMAAGLRAGLDALSQRLDGVVPAVTALEAGRKREEAAARDGLAALGGTLDRIERETAAALSERPLRAEVAQGGEATTARLAELSTLINTPRRRLLDTLERTAIFFKDDAVYRDPARTEAALGKLTEMLRAEPGARLRVIGLGDSLGTPKVNLKVGRLRAEKVAADLARLGVEPARLKVVAVLASVPVSDDVGTASANRRVTFEPIFADE